MIKSNLQEPELYLNEDTGEVVTPEVHHSIMMLIKILFRLNIIDDEQAVKIATKFRILFV